MHEKNNQLLSDFFGLGFELQKNTHQFFIQSDLSCDDFFTCVYRCIQMRRVESGIGDNDFSDLILAAFFALRGSPDFKLNFYSLDLPRQIVSVKYLDYFFRLLTNVSDLRQLNLNFRELQEQFVSGTNYRNTQFRINLRYFYDVAMDYIGRINQFKFDVLKHNGQLIKSKSIA